jgi:hypothetical protein
VIGSDKSFQYTQYHIQTTRRFHIYWTSVLSYPVSAIVGVRTHDAHPSSVQRVTRRGANLSTERITGVLMGSVRHGVTQLCSLLLIGFGLPPRMPLCRLCHEARHRLPSSPRVYKKPARVSPEGITDASHHLFSHEGQSFSQPRTSKKGEGFIQVYLGSRYSLRRWPCRLRRAPSLGNCAKSGMLFRMIIARSPLNATPSLK